MKLEGLVDMTKCLLIDEDGADRQRLEELLATLGVDTALMSGTDEAVQYCNDNAPELVLLSAEAPGMQPRDLVKRLRLSARGKPPVVFLYADEPDTDMIGQTILEGAADVLMMPFDRDLLQFKLRQAGVLS